jgi:Big-like domain-containing protein/putative pyrroloquinoline-quinone binding quinoprotein
MATTMPTVTPAKRKTLLPLFVVCGLFFLSAEAQAWQTNVSGSAGSGTFNATAVVEADGAVVAAGYFININNSSDHDFVVVKLDGASGTELWRHVISIGDAKAIALDGAGNVVAAGSTITGTSGGFTVVKLDRASGAELWRYVISGYGGWANAAAIDEAGNVVAAGVGFRQCGYPCGPLSEFIVVKLDGVTGQQLWLQNIEDENGFEDGDPVGVEDGANAVAVDGAGNVAVAGSLGYVSIVVKLDGVIGIEQWRRGMTGSNGRNPVRAVAVDGDGNVVVAGKAVANIGTCRCWNFAVEKFNGATGATLWWQTIHGTRNDEDHLHFEEAFAVAIDNLGDVTAGGTSNTDTGSDFTVVKFDGASGTESWRQTINNGTGQGYDSARAVAVDGAGNVVAAGVTRSSGSSTGFTVAKFNGADGTELWRRVINGTATDDSLDQANAVAVDGAGNVIAAGSVDGIATVEKSRGTDGGDFTPPVPDTEPPTVTMTAPANLAIVSGTITVSADASDNVGVASVQFRLDSAPLGAEDAEAPYAVTWDTTTAGLGQHSLTAVARDAAGNSSTATPVTVTVVNLPRIGILP